MSRTESEIPEKDYINSEGSLVVTMDLFELHHPDEMVSFTKWLEGQTTLVMGNGETGIYVSDYEKWWNRK